jgi:hypothetical protein
MTRADKVAAAYGLSLTDVQKWSDRALSVFERKAVELGLPGFTTTQPCGDDDEPEVLAW